MGKSITKAKKYMTAGDMAGNLTSDTIDVDRMDNVGIQLLWTGTPTGSIVVDGRIADDGPWTELDLDPAIAPAGSASDHLISLTQIPYAELRVRYVRTSGSGALTVWAMAKQIGG